MEKELAQSDLVREMSQIPSKNTTFCSYGIFGWHLGLFHWSCIFLLIGFNRSHLGLRQFWFFTLQWGNQNFQTLFHQSKFSLWLKWICSPVLLWHDQRKNTSPFEFVKFCYFHIYLDVALEGKSSLFNFIEIVMELCVWPLTRVDIEGWPFLFDPSTKAVISGETRWYNEEFDLLKMDRWLNRAKGSHRSSN